MKKQFIAGAVCPQCQKMDKVFVYQVDGEDIAQCNACGHQRVRPKEGAPQSERMGSDSIHSADAIRIINLLE